MEHVFTFLGMIVNMAKQVIVPSFGFSFYTFACGTFLLCLGCTYVSYLLGLHKGDDKDKSVKLLRVK